MKKKGGIFILILAVLLILFAFFTSGWGTSYIENYGYNFRVNMNTIVTKLHIPVTAGFREFLDEADNYQPQTEYDRLKMEYEKEEKSKEDETSKQTELDNEEYNTKTIKHTGKNIALSNASSARYASYSGGILCAGETQLNFYNANAVKKWSANVQISSPVLKTAGKYILLFEKNGEKFTLYKKSKEIYTNTVDGTIKTASVSSKGDVTLVLNRDSYKGSVAVYNKKGEEVYLWNSGTYSIIDSDISASRRLAVALLDSTGSISSKVYFFDIDKTEVDATTDINNALVFDIVFDGDILNAYADNKTMGINSNGKVKWTYDTENKTITKYAMSTGGTKVIAFDNENSSEITLVSASGAEKGVIKSEVLPDFVDIADNRLLYNDGRTVIITNLSGDVQAKYTCSRDVKKAYIIDTNNIFIVYGSSIEFLNLKGE